MEKVISSLYLSFSQVKSTELHNLKTGRSCSKRIASYLGSNWCCYRRDTTYGLLSNGNASYAIVCGGFEHGTSTLRSCFHLAPNSHKWTDTNVTMSQFREIAASIVINSGRTLWITGGLTKWRLNHQNF